MPIKLLLRDPHQVKPIKLYLEQNNWLNKSHKIQKQDDVFHIYTLLEEIPEDLQECEVVRYEESTPESTTLSSIIDRYCKVKGLQLEVPKRWSIYPPMILFNSTTSDEIFNPEHQELWESVLSQQKHVFGTSNITHIALNKPIIESDIMRRPHNLIPIVGDFGPDFPMDKTPTAKDFQQAFWCTVVQNGIYQTWAPKYTMFSRGNIKEKKRVLDNWKNLAGTVVVDFYCGIGYFSLSYLKNGGKLLCWELNPWSIEGFRKSLEKAGYKYKIYNKEESFDVSDLASVDACLFLESNEHIPERLQHVKDHSLSISHINLGLLPSSKPSWGIADELRRKSNIDTTIHIHENVHIGDFARIQGDVQHEFSRGEILYLEKVKTFAPDVWHIVIDVINRWP
ncbi:tRNA wybutosine-synthesizing protein 2 [Candida viswanathii]|uniref:tRNA wybutosine-synthesizing protein 2 n=1 Tax=Candida viswanathii TaxID=5486 RepID=A0A367XZD0_9ASCO|nr:tRNA wybutosine-synthesizing protein 2 [Candida viswanathii]